MEKNEKKFPIIGKIAAAKQSRMRGISNDWKNKKGQENEQKKQSSQQKSLHPD